MGLVVKSSTRQSVSPFQGESDIYNPTTTAVVSAYADEAFNGVGTLEADRFASRVEEAEKKGRRLSLDEYQASDYYRDGIGYYGGMTEEAAKVLAEFKDSRAKSERIIADASTAQTAIGFGTALVAGTFEPKNLGIGAATAIVGGPIWMRAAQAKELLKLRRIGGKYGAATGRGAREGLIAAAIAEPSNRSSAKTLQQDYTMMDTFFNVATSAVLGGALGAGGEFVRSRRAKAIETDLERIDTTLKQLLLGEHTEPRISESVRSKPIAEQAAAVEEVVRYTETPEFKARFGESKAVSESSAPVMFYRGTGFDEAPDGAIFYSDNPATANTYARGDVPRVKPDYLKIENPLEVDAGGESWGNVQFEGKTVTSNDIVRIARERGHDGVIIKNVIDRGPSKYFTPEANKPSTTAAVFSEEQTISGFGADDLDAITARMESERQAKIVASAEGRNNVAVDYEAAKALDEYEASEPPSYEESFGDYMAEIKRLREEGQLTEADEVMLTEAIGAINEADIESGLNAAYACLTVG